MSKASLRSILELLPEPCQERAILDCLQRMLSRGEWEQVDALLPLVCELSDRQSFKAGAIGIAAKCAIRARNFPLALERLEILSDLGTGEDILNARTDVLFQLAIQILPENPTPINQLWQLMLAENLRPDTQLTVGHIGFLLAKAYAKNRDMANERKTMQSMQSTLDKSVLDWLTAQFMPKKLNRN